MIICILRSESVAEVSDFKMLNWGKLLFQILVKY
jgi:hypothetical protein